ncbi:YggT family protein [Leucobacter chromiiresistens]|uniref:Membrane protein n=1 Tax=Leucobacter chromiiresistens TaxID=1079994 RepID=A0A147EQ65_9MICO|nr:YggT family protein [Leucobacter chromiiresistens]KTR86620.1 membrane protein [Leucobacter chromiiresistens]SDQ28936.1 YggT family protein [Leucobacter chromiiresistens]
MEIVAAIAFILRLALRIFTFVLWARFVLDWVTVLNRQFRPRGVWAVLVELVYTVTDPPIRMFRKIFPPIRLGRVALDLGWLLTMISCLILIAILSAW